MDVVVAGAGRWGQIHCAKVRACNWATLNGVIEPNAKRAAMVTQMYGVPTYPSLETCSEADFLIIASPWRDVARLVEQASARKLPFLAEKPVAVTSDVMRRLERSRASANVIGCVGYQLRFHPALNHFELGTTLEIVREERSFDSLWTLICDCGVHDIDLALRLAGGVDRLNKVSVSEHSVDVWASSQRGVDIHWHWRIGTEVTRSLVSGHSNIDFTKASEDLLSHQWEGVRRTIEGAQSIVATLDDATAVATVLEMVRAYAIIA